MLISDTSGSACSRFFDIVVAGLAGPENDIGLPGQLDQLGGLGHRLYGTGVKEYMPG